MNTIFQTLVYQREKGQDTVLATIIWDDGSAPRGAGSQMLVGRNGLLAGTIGGGAVEGQSIAIAREMLADGTDSMTREFRLHRDGSEQSTRYGLRRRCDRLLPPYSLRRWGVGYTGGGGAAAGQYPYGGLAGAAAGRDHALSDG